MKNTVAILVFSAIVLQGGNTVAKAQTSLLKHPAPVDSSQQLFDKIIHSKIPLLVNFWASWCKPCQLLAPILKEIEKEYNGKLNVIRINIEHHTGITSYFGVSTIPIVFLVKKRTVVNRLSGLLPKEAYVRAINDMLALDSSDSNNSPKKAETGR